LVELHFHCHLNLGITHKSSESHQLLLGLKLLNVAVVNRDCRCLTN
jgi:hypothetical protein